MMPHHIMGQKPMTGSNKIFSDATRPIFTTDDPITKATANEPINAPKTPTPTPAATPAPTPAATSFVTLLAAHYSAWTRDDVYAWSKATVGVTEEEACLLWAHRLNGRVLAAMSVADLRAMGISYGSALDLLGHLLL